MRDPVPKVGRGLSASSTVAGAPPLPASPRQRAGRQRAVALGKESGAESRAVSHALGLKGCESLGGCRGGCWHQQEEDPCFLWV